MTGLTIGQTVEMYSLSSKGDLIIDYGKVVDKLSNGDIHVRVTLDCSRIFKFTSKGTLVSGSKEYWIKNRAL